MKHDLGYSHLFSSNTTPVNPAIAFGKGALVYDVEGKKYIDFCSQTLNANLGQCHDSVNSAVIEQIKYLTCTSSRFSSQIAIELHQKLIDITPEPLSKVNLSSVTGSLANECAIKIARKKTGKEIIISFSNSHLGQSTETMRISGKHHSCNYLGERRTDFLPVPNCYHCPVKREPNSCNAECLESLEYCLTEKQGHDKICAVITEAIMVDAGVIAPPKKYHKRIRELCDQYNIILIWDEVQTAFGWLGTMFAMNLYDIVPDIVTLGKGLGAGFPLAATIFKPEYDVLNYGEHEMTSGAHPISCAASMAMIQHLELTDEFKNVQKKAEQLQNLLKKLQRKYPCIGDVPGMGLIRGVEFVHQRKNTPDPDRAYRVYKNLMREGVITRIASVGDTSHVLQIKPPLVITFNEIEEAMNILDKVIYLTES